MWTNKSMACFYLTIDFGCRLFRFLQLPYSVCGGHRGDRAASHNQKGRTSIAWLKERTSEHYNMAKEMETQKGKASILPPAPKKSFLDCASNRLARTIAQIRTGPGFVDRT
jgi:hypothetical protein